MITAVTLIAVAVSHTASAVSRGTSQPCACARAAHTKGPTEIATNAAPMSVDDKRGLAGR